MIYLALALLIGLVLAGWVLNLFNLPGNWLIVASAAFFAWWAGPESGFQLTWTMVAVVTGLAVLGEILEFVAGAAGTQKAGGSRRAAVMSIVGSMVGAIVGAGVGLPIPVVGSIVGAILFGGAGAMAGAMLGESWKGRALVESWRVGQGAFWGRLLGTAAKAAVGTVMAIITIVAAIF